MIHTKIQQIRDACSAVQLKMLHALTLFGWRAIYWRSFSRTGCYGNIQMCKQHMLLELNAEGRATPDTANTSQSISEIRTDIVLADAIVGDMFSMHESWRQILALAQRACEADKKRHRARTGVVCRHRLWLAKILQKVHIQQRMDLAALQQLQDEELLTEFSNILRDVNQRTGMLTNYQPQYLLPDEQQPLKNLDADQVHALVNLHSSGAQPNVPH